MRDCAEPPPTPIGSHTTGRCPIHHETRRPRDSSWPPRPPITFSHDGTPSHQCRNETSARPGLAQRLPPTKLAQRDTIPSTTKRDIGETRKGLVSVYGQCSCNARLSRALRN